jgi:Sulfatase
MLPRTNHFVQARVSLHSSSSLLSTLRMRMIAVCLAVLCLAVLLLPGGDNAVTAQVSQKPNVLFILTDDQDPESLARMANVQSLLVDQGTGFSHGFATTPLCCPSRVSFMRGQYAHNHGVLTNTSPHGGYQRFIELGLQDSTVATWLNEAGYATFYACAAGWALARCKPTRYHPNSATIAASRTIVPLTSAAMRYSS